MSCVPLPETSHDPTVRARPTVGPEGVSRSRRKPLGSPAALGHQSMSHVPCVCCRVLYHRGPQCVVSTLGEALRRRVSGVSSSHFWRTLGGCSKQALRYSTASPPHLSHLSRVFDGGGGALPFAAQEGAQGAQVEEAQEGAQVRRHSPLVESTQMLRLGRMDLHCRPRCSGWRLSRLGGAAENTSTSTNTPTATGDPRARAPAATSVENAPASVPHRRLPLHPFLRLPPHPPTMRPPMRRTSGGDAGTHPPTSPSPSQW
jgi:hypothetical protein